MWGTGCPEIPSRTLGTSLKSTSGYIIKHNNNPIPWGTKRQTVVALSTCAAEYIALSDGTQQMAQLNNLLIDMHHIVPMEIFCNNKAAIFIAGDNASKKKTHYLSHSFYFVNDFVRQYDIQIQWTSTHDQVANIFTKWLGPNIIKKALQKCDLKPSTQVKLTNVGGSVRMDPLHVCDSL
jgi:hypothetical protein